MHQSPHIILVHIVGFRVPAGALFELRLEPGSLIVGVVELAEAVRNLHTRDEQLEPLDECGVIEFLFGER